MKVSIMKEVTFDSAHYLPKYVGKCHNMHGHTYRLQVFLTGQIQADGPEQGMVLDFSRMKDKIKSLVEELDHKVLNEVLIPMFPCECPTAEMMASWIYWELNRMCKADSTFPSDVTVSKIRLYETPTSYAEVEGEE